MQDAQQESVGFSEPVQTERPQIKGERVCSWAAESRSPGVPASITFTVITRNRLVGKACLWRAHTWTPAYVPSTKSFLLISVYEYGGLVILLSHDMGSSDFGPGIISCTTPRLRQARIHKHKHRYARCFVEKLLAWMR